jgi:uncharacterized protein YeaO (DUF488 family)
MVRMNSINQWIDPLSPSPQIEENHRTKGWRTGSGAYLEELESLEEVAGDNVDVLIVAWPVVVMQ